MRANAEEKRATGTAFSWFRLRMRTLAGDRACGVGNAVSAGEGGPVTRTEALRGFLVCGFVAAFLAVLIAPLGRTIVRGIKNQPVLQENRKPARFPDMKTSKWRTLPSQFDSYFRDNLGMRQRFLNAYFWLFTNKLQSPVGRYLIGKNGELFEKDTVVNALGLNPKERDFLAMLRTTAAGTAAFFYLHDIPYYLFLVPDKSTLYSEWLPFYADFVESKGWYTDIESALQSADINFYPLKSFFDKNKNGVRFYDKIFDNCHWNGHAIKLFYQKIQDFIPKHVYDFDIKHANDYVHINNIIIEDKIYGDEIVPFLDFSPKHFLEEKTKEFFGRERRGWWEGRFFVNRNKVDKSIWMISDSYFLGTHGAGILPIFALNAHKCLNVHFDQFTSGRAKKWMHDTKPDIVIGEFAERMGGIGFNIIHDKKLTMLGDVWTNTPGYIIDKKILQSSEIINADLGEKEGKISFKALNDNASIIFPEVITDDYGHAMIMARMESNVNTNSSLFYSLAGNDSLVLSKSKMAFPTTGIKQGENYVHLHIIATPNTRVKLHFVPGAAAGTYTFLPIPEVEELKKKLAHGL